MLSVSHPPITPEQIETAIKKAGIITKEEQGAFTRGWISAMLSLSTHQVLEKDQQNTKPNAQ
jgi:hypothetical protein